MECQYQLLLNFESKREGEIRLEIGDLLRAESVKHRDTPYKD